MSHGSLGHQFMRAFQSIEGLGRSRHRAKQNTSAGTRIYGIRTLRDYIKIGYHFATFISDNYPEVKLARDVRPEMALDYMYWCRDVTDNAPGTLGRKASAIRKLDHGLRQRRWLPLDAPPLLSHYVWSGRHSPARPEWRYTPSEAVLIEQDLYRRDRQLGQVVHLMRAAGLRIREAVSIQADSIDPDTGTLHLTKRDGTKGGRPRVVTLDPPYRTFLTKLRKQGRLNSNGRVFQSVTSLRTRVYVAVRDSCQRQGIEMQGLHGFRKTYAQTLLASKLSAGEDDTEAMMDVSKALGHGRLDVLKHYVTSG